MKILVFTYFFILFLYVVSIFSAIFKKKFGQRVKSILKGINYFSLFFTVTFILLWTFDVHFINLTIELIPFWIFILSSILLFGFTQINKIEKVFYGLVFFGHLFFSLIVFIPFVGTGLTYLVYSYVMPDEILHEDKSIIITHEVRGLLAPLGPPFIYTKCGLFLNKYQTSLTPVYKIDSVSINRINNNQLEIKICTEESTDYREVIVKDTLDCDCL